MNLLVVSQQDAAAQRLLGSQSIPRRTNTHTAPQTSMWLLAT